MLGCSLKCNSSARLIYVNLALFDQWRRNKRWKEMSELPESSAYQRCWASDYVFGINYEKNLRVWKIRTCLLKIFFINFFWFIEMLFEGSSSVYGCNTTAMLIFPFCYWINLYKTNHTCKYRINKHSRLEDGAEGGGKYSTISVLSRHFQLQSTPGVASTS